MTSHQRKLGAPDLVGASFRRLAIPAMISLYRARSPYIEAEYLTAAKWPDCTGRFDGRASQVMISSKGKNLDERS
jgi:hypothetical protein